MKRIAEGEQFMTAKVYSLGVWELSHYAKQHPTASTRKGLNKVTKLGCAQLRRRFVAVIN
jgi:hypothetical protein